MIEIQLKHGKVLLIDEIDIPLINHYSWYAWCDARARGTEKECCYALADVVLANGKRSTLALHRLIAHASPWELVDHQDHNGLNNTRDNLRICSKSQNSANQQVRIDSASGYKGVHWLKREQKWAARIKLNQKTKQIGCYTDPIEAAKAYDAAAKELFGGFAYLNFPDGG